MLHEVLILLNTWVCLWNYCMSVTGCVSCFSSHLTVCPFCYLFSSANHTHMMVLLQQLLYSESLSLSWRDIIVPVVRQVVQTVRPDVRNCDDDMDIRQLVHIKKVRPISSKRSNFFTLLNPGFCLFLFWFWKSFEMFVDVISGFIN